MKKLLIVKLSSIGDILHALPVVRSIKDELPIITIGWVVREKCAGFLSDCQFIDKLYVIKSRPTVADLLKLASSLRSENYDTVFDMQGLFLSGVVSLLSGAKRRVGLNRNRELNRLFLTEPTIEGKKPRHAIDILLEFRNAAGLKSPAGIKPVDHLGATDSGIGTSQSRPDEFGRVVLNVGASTLYKRWPLDRWVALGHKLISNGYRVTLTAGPSETADADQIASNFEANQNLHNLGGKTTQEQLASLFRRSDLVISGDTGPLHLAVAVGTPTVALFGSTDPRLTGPYGPNHQVIWKQLPCSPCFRHPTCDGRVDCLKAISAEEVFIAATTILRTPTANGAAH